MIPEEEVDAAIEVMNATPEELPEEGGADVPPPLLKYPTFLDWAVTGAALLLFFGIAVVLATMLEELGQSRYGGYYESGQLEPRDMLLYLVVVVPVGALAVAVLLKVFMAPLVIWDGDRWMGMIAYLWVRWILFVVVPIALAVAFGALRPEEG
ncbi:hypothetical protein [Roseimicrobium gellanilyticum]|nr:hypothetical protein [Roseimicrobium gellanilyticum]